MADEKQTTGQEEHIPPETGGPENPGTAPGDMVVDFERINDLVKKRNAEKREAIEQEEAAAENVDSFKDPDSVGHSSNSTTWRYAHGAQSKKKKLMDSF